LPRQQYKYLTPETVEQVGNLELIARTIVEGFLQGLHRSPFHGFSVEFSEYREYAPGDPLRFIDWQVYARTDRYMIRQFEEETNMRAYIILDGSASMNYRGNEQRLTKFQYSAYLAAALIYLMNRQHDAVGLFTLQDKIHGHFPPRVSPMAVREMLLHLDKFEPGNQTGIVPVMHRVAESIKHRSLVIVISDLLDDVEGLRRALLHFRHKRNEVIVLHVMDETEETFPFRGLIEFQDMETGQLMEVEAAQLRDGYKQGLATHLDAIAKTCADGRIDYQMINTTTPFDRALAFYLAQRKRLY